MGRTDGSHWYYSYLPMGISGGATSTLIPLFAYALGGNLFHVGIIAAATSIASVPAFILWGGACDRRGRRKPFLLIGFLGSGIALLAMAASRTMSEFYLANLLAGFLGAASGPAGTVLLMETSKREDWPARLAIMSRMTATGWVAGLALGILWLAAGPDLVGRGLTSMRYLFAIGAALAFSAGFVVQVATREAAVRVDRKDVHLVDAHPRVERGRYLPTRIVHFVGPLTDSSGDGVPRPLRLVRPPGQRGTRRPPSSGAHRRAPRGRWCMLGHDQRRELHARVPPGAGRRTGAGPGSLQRGPGFRVDLRAFARRPRGRPLRIWARLRDERGPCPCRSRRPLED